jgi:hypothetical protein
MSAAKVLAAAKVICLLSIQAQFDSPVTFHFL